MTRHDTILRTGRWPVAQRQAARCAAASWLLLGTLLLAACAPEPMRPTPRPDPSQLYWALRLDHHAVTLSIHAPYDTLRLVATPVTASGAVLSDAPRPRFYSTDVERVQVDSTGLLRAIKVGRGIAVVAVDTVEDIVHADTVWVNVNDVTDPPVLAALAIEPVPDSAKYALGGTFLDLFSGVVPHLTVRATDGNGAEISMDSLAVAYASTDTMVAMIDPVTGVITPQRVGRVTFIATATAYGVTKADTVPFTIGLPLSVSFMIETRVDAHGDTVPVFPSAPAVIGVGGDVIWHNTTSLPVDVTFDDPTNVGQDDTLCTSFLGALAPEAFCGVGNIAAWTVDTLPTGGTIITRVRQFLVPGTYHYRSTRYGTTGTIIVKPE